ncbi:hypothetical protein OE88DRAFT_488776 [Heliocybe sulcata]|uniref:Uncharacterized protein n=1 Tax=Heliocybe sulcata TaxID=5364 RepID=A0A5C3MUC3_9AGAM|nr:hypothetical protein OE88DRAFT_488776 [Heliocybe sulcata]
MHRFKSRARASNGKGKASPSSSRPACPAPEPSSVVKNWLKSAFLRRRSPAPGRSSTIDAAGPTPSSEKDAQNNADLSSHTRIGSPSVCSLAPKEESSAVNNLLSSVGLGVSVLMDVAECLEHFPYLKTIGGLLGKGIEIVQDVRDNADELERLKAKTRDWLHLLHKYDAEFQSIYNEDNLDLRQSVMSALSSSCVS